MRSHGRRVEDREGAHGWDPSFAGYLRELRSGPAFGLRLGAFLSFALALLLDKGVATLLLTVGAVVLVALVAVYPSYRRSGPSRARRPPAR